MLIFPNARDAGVHCVIETRVRPEGGLRLAERTAITETTATRYQLASKRGKGNILDELCANSGWHRNHAREALNAALRPRINSRGCTTKPGSPLKSQIPVRA